MGTSAPRYRRRAGRSLATALANAAPATTGFETAFDVERDALVETLCAACATRMNISS